MTKKRILVTGILSLCFVLFFAMTPVLGVPLEGCSDPLGLDCAGASGLSNEDPRVITVRIINFALSLLGIIAVCIILWAGFTWMTAGGNDEKVGSAKKILFAAVMGLIIIMVSYSIMSFVLRSLCETTGSCGTNIF